MKAKTGVAPLLAGVLLLISCGGQSTPPQEQVTLRITVAPASSTLDQGATAQYSATVTGTSNNAVSWSVQEGSAGGTITSSGSYTAPQKAGTFHVVATSVADTSKSAIATVTVRAVSVALAAPSSILDQGALQQYTATVTGAANSAVNWSVQESGGGSVTPTGLYTAPAAAGTFHVVATSQADSSKTAIAAVTVHELSITLSPTSSEVYQGVTRAFTATVAGTVNTAVIWSVQEGEAGGSITGAGMYTAPWVDGTYHVVATSQANPSKSAVATVTVPSISIAVSPATDSLRPEAVRKFNAVVSGMSSSSTLIWTVEEGAAGGTVDDNGTYVAPGTLGTYHVFVALADHPSTNATAVVNVVASGFTATGSMSTGRHRHTATLLDGGKVLIAGGSVPAGATAELYDPDSGSFKTTGSMVMGRSSHTATLLNNSKVLIAGGYVGGGYTPAMAELYDTANGTFTTTGSMSTGRSGHTATLLDDGKVLIAGGYQPDTYGKSSVATAELYDPASETFVTVGSMSTGRALHTATRLADGRVLVTGGDGNYVDYDFDDTPRCDGSLRSSEIFDPSTGSFTPGENLYASKNHTASLLWNGQVLVAGGELEQSCYAGDYYAYWSLAHADVFYPATATFASTASMSQERYLHTATALTNGKVLVVGGGKDLLVGCCRQHETLFSAELYEPSTGAFTFSGSLGVARFGHTATLLRDGRVLVIGGLGEDGGTLASAEIYE